MEEHLVICFLWASLTMHWLVDWVLASHCLQVEVRSTFALNLGLGHVSRQNKSKSERQHAHKQKQRNTSNKTKQTNKQKSKQTHKQTNQGNRQARKKATRQTNKTNKTNIKNKRTKKQQKQNKKQMQDETPCMSISRWRTEYLLGLPWTARSRIPVDKSTHSNLSRNKYHARQTRSLHGMCNGRSPESALNLHDNSVLEGLRCRLLI